MGEAASAVLMALAGRSLGGRLSLGGAFALAYYHEYRETHDIDAWWEPTQGEAARREVVNVAEEALRPMGDVRTRSWGDVVSVELRAGGKVTFALQVAQRSARLAPPMAAPWPPGFWLDALDDLIASKMVALVERGAPRDFRDIHVLCQVAITQPAECWGLWRRRQEAAGGDAHLERARLAISTHLARIERHRPLDGIAGPEDRARAADLRQWFKETFLDARLD